MHSVVYYRISDVKVIGSTTSQNEPNIEAELPNWGPGVAALRVDFSEVQTGKIRRVVNGVLTHEDDLDYIVKQKQRKSALDKVKQKLGITDDELRIIFGG